MLSVRGLCAGYGAAQALYDVDLDVASGEVVALLGRNGMGKTTTIKAIMGLITPRAGEIIFDGQMLSGQPAFRAAQAGLGLVPEGRQIFPTLTVEENLIATAASRFGPARWTVDRLYALFPRLKERRRNLGSQLSGGEQQMLAVGRALMTNPKLLILDEATEGLAPLIRREIWDCITDLKSDGESILVIDKALDALRKVADKHVVIEKGHIVWSGTNAELAENVAFVEGFLHV